MKNSYLKHGRDYFTANSSQIWLKWRGEGAQREPEQHRLERGKETQSCDMHFFFCLFLTFLKYIYKL